MKDLKSLFESDLLNEETKVVLQEAFDTAIKAKVAEVETQYATKLTEAKTEMTSNLLEMIEEAVNEEIAQISDEIVEARTLEVRYANKLEDFKQKYDEKIQEQVKELVDTTVNEELYELKEDIEFAKKHQFVMSMFEAYKGVYEKTFGETDFDIHAQLEESQKELSVLKREKVLNDLLESLNGAKREVALTILEGVATEKLEAKFESIRPILLEAEEEKEEQVEESKEVEGKIVLEGEEPKEEQKQSKIDDAVVKQLQRSLKIAASRR